MAKSKKDLKPKKTQKKPKKTPKNPKTQKKSQKSKQKKQTKKVSNKTNSTETKLFYRPALVGTLGFIMQFIISVASYYSSVLRVPYDRTFWIMGVILIFGGFIVTYLYQTKHEELKVDVLNTIKADEVSSILTGGIYGVVRHPGYLGTIMMQLGMAFASRSYLPLFFAVLMSVFWGLLAAREEVFLKSEFGSEYEDYKEEVPWRFIPGLY